VVCSLLVLNMMRFPNCDPTGLCNSEPDPDRIGFGNKLYRIKCGYPNCIDHYSKMFNQRVISDINRIGSNIWTVLPDLDRTGLHDENIRLIKIAKVSDPFNTVYPGTCC